MRILHDSEVWAGLLEAVVPALPFFMLLAGFLLGWAVKGLLSRLWRESVTPAAQKSELRPIVEPSARGSRITRQEKREIEGLLDKIPHFLHQFLEAESPGEIAGGLINAFCHLFNLEEAGVWLREGDEWTLSARNKLSDCPAEARMPLKAGRIGHAAQAAKPLLREDFERTSGLERARILESLLPWDDFDLYVPLGTRTGLAEGVVVCRAENRDQLSHMAPLANILGSLGALTLRNLEQRRRFRELAELDFLTGLPSRMAFFKRLEAHLDPARGLDFFFVLLDLDHFKEINDRLGHQVGDFTLKAFARALKSEIQEFESAGRLGGEEFGLILICPEEEITRRLRRLLDRIASMPVEPPGVAPLHVTASAGLAHYPDDAVSASELYRVADQRLYQAKEAGRNQAVWGRTYT